MGRAQALQSRGALSAMMGSVNSAAVISLTWMLALLAGMSWNAQAQRPEILLPGYTVRLWEAADGLPDQTAQAFAQTQDGSLWIGTKGGLLRFDGRALQCTGGRWLRRRWSAE